jgi:ABC-type sugar transport system ATPase subunit
MLELKHITKEYPEVTAVRDVSLTIGDTERVAIRGESGCGKSTLLGIIAGLILPDAGEVLRDGRKLSPEPHLRGVSMVFQNGTLWNHMTVRENILFGSPFRQKEKREEQVRSLAEELELTELLNRYPGQISGGQARRAAIARALACRRELLLLDEPFTNLDKEGKGRVLESVRRLCAGTCAVLLVTHNAQEAEALCERQLTMEEGELRL